MKRTLTLVTAAICCAFAIFGIAATGAQTEYAAAETRAATSYPDFISELDIGGADSYAVGENAFAFSDGRYLYIYEGGTLTTETDENGNAMYVYEGGELDADISEGQLYAYVHGSAIVNMSFDGDDLLFSDGSGVYLYSDGEVTSSTATIPEIENPARRGNLTFYILNASGDTADEGILSVGDGTHYLTLNENSYSDIKIIDDSMYILRDGQLCVISGSTLDSLTLTSFVFRYIDMTQDRTISVGDTAERLKDGGTPVYARVPTGQYMTEIDISDLSGEYFTVGESGTFIVSEASDIVSGTYVFVLCTSGNADVVAIGSKTYLTPSLAEKTAYTVSDAPFEAAQLNYSASIYSLPYICDATELIALQSASTVEVLEQIVAEGQTAGSALMADFCKVRYTADDGATTEGYIPTVFLTMYDFSSTDGEFTDPTLPEDYSEDNVILVVVLVIVIVILVIIGVIYLALVSGANRRKRKNLRPGGEREYDEIDDADEQ